MYSRSPLSEPVPDKFFGVVLLVITCRGDYTGEEYFVTLVLPLMNHF